MVEEPNSLRFTIHIRVPKSLFKKASQHTVYQKDLEKRPEPHCLWLLKAHGQNTKGILFMTFTLQKLEVYVL